jgi:hypothetical protein
VTRKFHYPDRSLNHLVQILETQLDSAIQMIEKNSQKQHLITIKLRRCLGIARRLQQTLPHERLEFATMHEPRRASMVEV